MKSLVKQIVEEDILNLMDVDIGGEKYKIDITNPKGQLRIDFNNGEYRIIIEKDGVRMERRNEECATEHYLVKKDIINGTMYWDTFKYSQPPWNNHVLLQVPFGREKRDYSFMRTEEKLT